MNIKSNKVLSLSLVSLLSVVPALQAWRPSMPSCPSFISMPAGYVMNGCNHAKGGLITAAGWTKDKAVAGSCATGRGIKVASAWSLDKSEAAGRHVWNNKKKYAAATTATVLAALACMYPDVVREYAKNAYEAITGFDYAKRYNQTKEGVSSLWKRVLRK